MKKLSGTSAGGIYFDGRDDYTLQKTALGSTSLIKEGHYTIRAHPGDVYLGFAVPKSGTGENIATAVIDYLESVGVSTADTEILGADRCRWDHRQHWTPQRLDEEHGAAPWTISTESCVHVTPGGVATEEDVRAPRRPHNWSSELLWPYWKATWWHVMIQ